MQVILSEKNEIALYLVNEGGVIKNVSLTSHVPGDDSRESTVIDCSALCDTSELERLPQLTSLQSQTLQVNLRQPQKQ